ncbi:hypothetical protein JF634_06100 [Simonsiella muelleri]|jgi:hypothetical protein|uniref:hypothetical protein n=1 Tax=Simonsiella muelleri TaxID=72 RepID=UPI0002DE79CE|nr:hypothetical protein [Simonsiella muelleri]UBQ55034.1 hypothetical protein JF634_06100 [Simonsiella muelleri]
MGFLQGFAFVFFEKWVVWFTMLAFVFSGCLNQFSSLKVEFYLFSDFQAADKFKVA